MNDPHLYYCPKPGCWRYIRSECKIRGKKNKAQCECGHIFCTGCAEPWHEEQACEDVRDKGLVEFQRNNNVTYCPHCKSIIERIEGCPHMHCATCGRTFNLNFLTKYLKYSPARGSAQESQCPPELRCMWQVVYLSLLPFFLFIILFDNARKSFENGQNKWGWLWIVCGILSMTFPIIYLPFFIIIVLIEAIAFPIYFLIVLCVVNQN
ncbi:unnamed protein product [Moneuplotes crassus]|uniref:RBR-type E3 ubiquitin transferase n=1 Tax=Euplotes crassus TaxID=5936 RepID=A0AAD1UNC6_EUPCR|nr:unnamed protein product [Moneuplotes crassus]